MEIKNLEGLEVFVGEMRAYLKANLGDHYWVAIPGSRADDQARLGVTRIQIEESSKLIDALLEEVAQETGSRPSGPDDSLPSFLRPPDYEKSRHGHH